jgi:DNA repair protein RadA/Sms
LGRSRARLTIARPQPELTDPVQELNDIGGAGSGPGPVPISEISEKTFVRDLTGLPPLDHVLGGGLVVASVVLLAATPGSGKTTLTLQMLDGLGHRTLYVTGEETEVQVAATARRVGVVSSNVYVFAECNLENIFAHARALRAQTIAIDSIQKMSCDDVNGRAGSPAQLKECSARLVKYAKATKTALWLIGHVTGDGDIAGPKTIEHDVDVVLELERGPKFEGNERILNCFSKNRFGATNVKGCFELTPKGFVSVDADGWDEKL